MQGEKMSTAWEYESMLYDEEGNPIWSPFQRQMVIPARVILEGDKEQAIIRYWWWWKSEGPRVREPEPSLLIEFANLADAPEGEVLEFARRWGPLGLCCHEHPFTHDKGCWREHTLHFSAPAGDVGSQLDYGYGLMQALKERDEKIKLGTAEPINSWRRYARGVKAILMMAADLHQGEYPDGRLLAVAGDLPIYPLYHPYPSSYQRLDYDHIGMPSLALEYFVDVWLEESCARPRLSWPHDSRGPRVVIGGVGLFGALGIQLLFSTTATRGVEVCNGCGRIYHRDKRRARSGQRNYCDECGRRAATRDAKRDYRIRRSKERKEQGNGKAR